MLGALLIILILLWFLGYIAVPIFIIPNFVIFTINGQPITLWSLLILAIVLWILSLLPAPFQAIAGILLLLWLLSILGIFSGLFVFPELSNLLVLAIILGLLLLIFTSAA